MNSESVMGASLETVRERPLKVMLQRNQMYEKFAKNVRKSYERTYDSLSAYIRKNCERITTFTIICLFMMKG